MRLDYLWSMGWMFRWWIYRYSRQSKRWWSQLFTF